MTTDADKTKAQLIEELERRRRGERTLLDSEETRHKSEERLQAIISSIADYLMVLDREHRVQQVNRVIEGMKPEQVIGKLLYKLAPGGQQEIQQVKDHLDWVLQHAESRRYHTAYPRPDGKTIHFCSIAAPIVVGGEVTGTVVSCRDVTDQIRLEEECRQAQKMESIGQLAGGVAHDFNNLLTIINSYASMALGGLSEADPLTMNFEQILDAGQRAATLTRQLLAFSRKQLMQPQILDINTTVTNLEKMLRRVIGENIECSTMLAEDLGRVRADPGQVEQMLMNLAVNAKDAMPRGGQLRIHTANIDLDEEFVSTHSEMSAGPYVMLTVADNGAGMNAATKERIFEPFYTTKELGQGTGLGLSTVYGIVKQSSGEICVHSELGQGTTFKVYLPRLETDEKAPRRETNASSLHGTERVLVVEDEEAVRIIASRILMSAGYQVTAAADGLEALTECEQHGGEFSLVLTDVVMPKMGGEELARQLLETYPHLQVVFMSGYTNNTVAHDGILNKGTHFIAKPFTASKLLTKIRIALDGG
ncbi:MAG: response regulator [Deltaproteobacteria bacterium]|nr:response regulator [Deltaproteobacteria bacterium]